MVSIYLLTKIKTSCHKGNIYLPQNYMYNSTLCKAVTSTVHRSDW